MKYNSKKVFGGGGGGWREKNQTEGWGGKKGKRKRVIFKMIREQKSSLTADSTSPGPFAPLIPCTLYPVPCHPFTAMIRGISAMSKLWSLRQKIIILMLSK